MCGRFARFATGKELAEHYQVREALQEAMNARYNIAPTQPVVAVRATEEGRSFALFRWGLIPSWSTDPAIGNKLINARSETVAEKPSFRSAFKHRRCLIPVSGFYEWQKRGTDRKQPFFIRPHDKGLFSFAGLWERWHSPEGEEIETCTILTTKANEVMRPLHERMPVILDASGENLWLDSRTSAEDLRSLFAPFPAQRTEAYPIGLWVNNARHEGPQCLEPLGA